MTTQIDNNLTKKINEFAQIRHNFVYLVAQKFANTIACSEPKITFSNKKITKIWNKHKTLNNFLKINADLVYKSSVYGCAFIGITPLQNFSNNEILPNFTIGLPLETWKIGFEFVRLNLLVDVVKENFAEFFVTQIWDVSADKNPQFFGREILNRFGVTFPEKLEKWFKNQPRANPIGQRIPYVPVYSNASARPDLWNVPTKLFNYFDSTLDTLKTDMIFSKGILIANLFNASSSINQLDEIKKCLETPGEVMCNYSSDAGGFLVDNAIDFSQGKSNAENILKVLDYFEKQIKKFGFMSATTENLGTKNALSSEVENLNSDFEDYVEHKANLLEVSWKNFFEMVYIPFLKYQKIINGTLEVDVDVEVPGSTKYLQNSDNKYIQNQAGVLVNPNDLENDQKMANEEKKNEE